AIGWVSGLVNAFPGENRLLWDAAKCGKYEEALKIYRWYTPLLHLDTHIKLVQYIKLAMAETGLGSEMVRPPRLPVVRREREEILALIRQAIKTRPTKSVLHACTVCESTPCTHGRRAHAGRRGRRARFGQ